VGFIMPAGATTGLRKLVSVSATTRAGVYITVSAGSSTTLLVNKENTNGDLLPGSCFWIYVDAGGGSLGGYVAGTCDPNDGSNDGVVTFTRLIGGDYVLKETHAPNGYLSGAMKRVHVAASGTTSVTVVDHAGGATLTIHKVDANTNAVLTGACWIVFRDDGTHQLTDATLVEERCDRSDGSENGVTPFTGLGPGTYILYEDVAPAGYAYAANTPFSIDAAQDPVSLTVTDQPLS
jgi:uncharacterized surface anchored protein